MSANATSIKFGGVDLWDYRLMVVSPKHPYLPMPRVGFQPFTGADGGASFGSSWDRINFDFLCVICGTSPAQFSTYVNGLVAHLRDVAQDGEQQLILGWDNAVYYNARLSSGIDCEVAITGGTFDLSFFAPEGTSYPV